MCKSVAVATLVAGVVFGALAGGLTAKYMNCGSAKIAKVDVNAVIMASPRVNELKEEQQKRIESLMTFVEQANRDIRSQKDMAQRTELEKKYGEELNAKKTEAEEMYAQQLAKVDAEVTAQIKKDAADLGYSVVLAKMVVVAGGDDITSQILDKMK